MREIPVVDIAHPLVDEVGETAGGARWVMTESRAAVIFLTPGRVDLVNRAAQAGRRLVVVTDEYSRLSPLFADVWRDSGAGWVVKDAQGGMRDGFSGRRLTGIDQVWAGRAVTSFDELAVNHLRPVELDAVEITAIVSVRHPARQSTLLGAPLTALSEAALGAPPQLWDHYEPLGQPWDRRDVTDYVRGRMPQETMILAGRPGLLASVSAARTAHGVEEVTHAHLSLTEPSPAAFTATRSQLTESLVRLAETSMPLVGLLLAHPGRSDLLRPPFLQAPPTPLCLLIGPPAVRSLGLSVDQMHERFDARQVGRPRIPGLLFGLGDDSVAAWTRLDDILATVGSDRLAGVLGLAAPKLGTARASRAAGGDHAQP